MNGIEKLYTGDFNDMTQEWLPDGSVIVTLSKRGEDKTYRFRVRDLYGEHEEVSEEQVIPVGPPPWILDRMKGKKRK